MGDKNWLEFKKAINSVAGDFNKKEITHLIYNEPVDQNNEEVTGFFVERKIEVLQNHNYMRTWPITKARVEGDVDNQSVQIFINKEYLRNKGWLTQDLNYSYNPGKDFFVIDGLVYQANGDTSASQTNSSDLHYLIILRREEINTHDFDIR